MALTCFQITDGSAMYNCADWLEAVLKDTLPEHESIIALVLYQFNHKRYVIKIGQKAILRSIFVDHLILHSCIGLNNSMPDSVDNQVLTAIL